MVAIVAGNGLGIFNASNNVLGSLGVLGDGLLGQAGGQSYVNAATGNLVLQFADERLSGQGTDLAALRTYNSLGTMSDGLGSGWTQDGERSVAFGSGTLNAAGSTVTRTDGDGHVTTFTWNASLGMYTSGEGGGSLDTLQRVTVGTGGSATHQWVFTDGSTRQVERYADSTVNSVKGQLLSQTDASGNEIDYGYTGSLLTSITDHGSGQKIQLVYGTVPGSNLQRLLQLNTFSLTVDANNRATSTVGTALSQVTYAYDSMGRLTSVSTDLTPNNTTDNAVYTSSYTYASATSQQIASVSQSDGSSVSFTYDGSGRVKSVTDASGTQTFAYGVGTKTINGTPATSTTITNATGQVWTYYYDSNSDADAQQLLEIDSPATADGPAPVTQFAYDANGNVSEITQGSYPNGSTALTISSQVIYQYDASGNRILERDSLGNTITRTFDAANQLLTETHYLTPDPNGLNPGSTAVNAGSPQTTYYVYDSDERLRFTVSAEGRVTEYRYESGGYGNLTRSISYAAQSFSGTLSVGSPPSEAALASWAASQDQTQTEQTQYTYDLRGNLASRTDYATVNSSGSGVLDSAATVSNYIYDTYGQLLQTIQVHSAQANPNAVLTSYAYDGLGRQTTRVDASGTQTTTYNDAQHQIVVSNSSTGLSQVSAFDSLGRLVSVTQTDLNSSAPSATRETEYLYDADGQLVATQSVTGTDPTTHQEIIGSRSFRFYDADGRLAYTVDATGDVTGFSYDSAGRVTAQTSYANTISATVLNGWVTATVVTNNATSPPTFTTNYTLNKSALSVGAIGSTGNDVAANSADRTTQFVYDLAGRLVAEIDAARVTTTTSYDGDSRVIKQQIGSRVTQYFYDADGNQVGVLDPLGYLTENKFDAAGRLVESDHYTTRSPGAPDSSAPVFVGASNQALTAGQFFSYRIPAYDADGDQLIFKAVGTLPSWLTMTTDAGGVTLSGTPPATLTSYSVTLLADDGRGTASSTTTATVQLTVGNSPPSWATLPSVQVVSNTANYTLVLPAATDDISTQAQLKYSINAALLPPGLSFNAATRTISGTPTTAGSYVITAQVTDAGTPPLSTTRTFVLQVTNVGPSWSMGTTVAPSAVRAQVYNLALPGAVDPENQTLSYRVVSAPAWLTLNSSSAPTLSGTPPMTTAAVGPQPVVLEATDTFGETVRLSFIVNVVNLPPTFSAAPANISVLAGGAVNYTPPVATDPEGLPVTYSYTGTLPQGLSFNTSTGQITGTTHITDVNNYPITLIASTGEPGDSVSAQISINLLNTAPTYQGGIADSSGLYFNWIDINVPFSAFGDVNGDHLTFSVPGAIPSLRPVDNSGSGIYFAPAFSGSGYTLSVLDNNPADINGTVIPVTVVATDSHGASATHVVNVTIVSQLPPPGSPPPHLPPPGPGPKPPGGGPPISRKVVQAPPSSPVPTAPAPVLVPAATATASAMPPAPRPLSISPVVDVLAPWRPTDTTDALRSFYFYDGEGRQTGVVDQNGFLTATTYNQQTNTQQTTRYFTPLTVAVGGANPDTLSSLEGRAGAAETSITQFDAFNRVSSITGVDGSLTQNTYDQAGRLIRQVSAVGTSDQQSTRTVYDAFGDVTGILGGVGDATLPSTATAAQINTALANYGSQFKYDSLGNRISEVDADGVDANGNVTRFFYDAQGRLTQTVNAVGDVSEKTYDAFSDVQGTRNYSAILSATQLAALTGGSNSALTPLLKPSATADQITSASYDARGLLTQSVDALGFTTSFSYDNYGQLIDETRTIAKAAGTKAASTTTTEFDYDLDGHVISQTADVGGLNNNTQTSYDAYGRVIQSVDATGKLTQTSYQETAAGSVVTVKDPLNRSTTTTYDALNRVVSQVDALRRTTQYVYDDSKRSIAVTLGYGTADATTVTTYLTRNGQTASVVDGRGNTTNYLYNADGQLTQVTDALGNPVSKDAYDNSGRLISTIDANGTKTQLSYDALNRVVKRVVDPSVTGHTGLNLTTQYGFNQFGQELTVTEGAGTAGSKVTSFRYDLDGNLTQVIVDPGTGALQLATSYSYDGLGDVLTVSQGTLSAGNQQVTQYVFDKLGRRIAQIDAPSSVLGAGAANERDLTTTYKYDADGRVTRSIDPDGNSTWFLYDADGELTDTVNALGEVSENSYDAAGQLVQTRQYATAVDTSKFGDAPTSAGAVASASDQRSYFVYDNDGRQVYSLQATDGTHWTLSQRIYDANGNVIETRTYDQAIPDSWVSANTASGTAPISAAQVATELSSLGYTSDSALNLSQRTRFAFDADNRLRFTVDALGDVSELTYDNAGNVTQAVRFAAVPTLSAYTESAISAAVDGTAPNNLRADPNNQVTNFSYDAAGRLHYTVQVLASDGKGNATSQLVTELDYDALGRLVQRTAYATKFGAISDPGQTSGNDYSAGNIATFLKGKNSAQDRTSAFVYDAAGRQIYAVQVLTDSTGTITQLVTKQTYDALGHVLQSTAYATPMTLSDYQKTTLDNAVAANASAADRTTSFVYDAEGRVRFVVAPDNTLSETVYDAAGRVLEQRHFDLTVSASTPLTEAALVGRRANRQVGDGVTRGQKFTYDAAGELLTTTDALGNVQTNTYDKLGNLASSTDGRGATWQYGYDLLGRLVDTFSPLVAVQLSNQSTPANQSLDTHITYDTFGNVATRTLAYGTVDAQQTGYVYDTLGRLTKTILPGYYDPVLGKVTATAVAGDNSFVRTVQTSYDALGNAVRTQVQTGANTYQYEYSTYDTLGRLSYVVNALNYVTGYTYDAFGDQASVTSYNKKLGSPPGTGNQWDGTSVAAAVAGDTASRTINISYDNLGRKIAVSNPASSAYASYNPNTGTATAYSGSATTKFTYDVFGDLLQQSELVDGSSNQWRNTFYYYDSMGRQTLSVDAMGYQTANTYDTQGNLLQTIEYANAGALGAIGAAPGTPQLSSNDRITAFAYNVDNEQTSVTRYGLDYMALQGNSYVEVHNARSVGTVVSTSSYDADGNLTTQTDALGNTTTTAYNALGQVTSITEPARLVANANSVDPFLNQVSATPVTSFVLNAFGQAVTAIRTTVVSGGQAAGATLTTHQSYDAGGNLISSTDANGNVTTLQVDYAGRVIAKTQQVSATLQQLGLTQDQNLPNSGTSLLAGFTQTLQQRFVYDALGQQTDALTVYTDANGLEQTGTHNTYDAFGEITDQLSESGAASTAPGSLSQVEVAKYAYDNAGRVTSRQDSSGLTRFAYNGLGQVVWQQQVGDPTKGDIARNTFVQYDILGRVTLQQQASYYDPELANDDGDQSAFTSPLILQSFDRWGNVVSRTVGTALMQGFTVFRDSSESATTTYDYNADNQLIAAHLPTATDTFGANNASTPLNVTQVTRYDVLGRQVEQQELADIATTPGNDAIQLRTPSYNRYNAIGQLISETDNAGITTQFAYDANGNRIGTMDANGTVLIDGFDNNGNNTSHGVLRAPMSTAYFSGTTSTSGVIDWTLDRYSYDQANRRIASTTFTNVGFNAADPLLQFTTLTQYDERNLVRVTYQGAQNFSGTKRPGEVTNVITYDQFGDKLTQTDANQNTQSFSYNTGAYQVGHITSSSVGGLTTNYTYDDFGELTAESGTDSLGRAFSNTYSYFADGRLLSVVEQEDDGLTAFSLDQKSQTSVEYAYTVTGQQKEQDENTTVTDNPGDGTSNILISDDDTVFTSYDALGRVTDIATPNNQSTSLLKSIHYAYDGLDNRTEIVGSYYDSNHNLNVSTQWFAFDADNRAVIVDGVQQGNGSVGAGSAGIIIGYDKDGRRSGTISTVAGASVTDSYQYNDLGYLTEIDETNPVEFGGSQFVKELRQYDDTGRLLSDDFGTMNAVFSRVVGGAPTTYVQAYDKQVTGITYDYLGNLLSENTHEITVNATTNTGLTYSRDNAGNVTSYVVGVQTLQNDGSFSAAVKTDYNYHNVLTQNGYQVQSIHAGGEIANNPSKATTDTLNQYDVHGDLLSQRVVNSNGAGQSSAATNFFAYDAQGRILSKSEANNTGSTENYFYANGAEVADIGTGDFKIAQFTNSYTPVSEVYPAATPGSYVVNSTDTLATIAQTVFGDPSLWYLIADANNLQFGPNDALPATEVGKTYIIPNVVANVQGSSSPFAPFDPASIGAPQPAALPAPNDTGCSGTEKLVATVIIAVGAAAVAAYTGGAAAAALGPLLGSLSGSAAAGTIAAGVVGGAIGAAAGDAAAQGAGDEFGLHSGFNTTELGYAALSGAVGGLANQLGGLVSGPLGGALKGAGSAAGTIAINAARSESFDPYSLIDIALQAGTNAAVGDNGGVPASRGVLDVRKGVEQLTEALLNPLTGVLVSDQNRTWANLENAALNDATSVLGDALGRGALTIGATNPAAFNKAHVGSGAVAQLDPDEEAKANGQPVDVSDGVPLDVSDGVPLNVSDGGPSGGADTVKTQAPVHTLQNAGQSSNDPGGNLVAAPHPGVTPGNAANTFVDVDGGVTVIDPATGQSTYYPPQELDATPDAVSSTPAPTPAAAPVQARTVPTAKESAVQADSENFVPYGNPEDYVTAFGISQKGGPNYLDVAADNTGKLAINIQDRINIDEGRGLRYPSSFDLEGQFTSAVPRLDKGTLEPLYSEVLAQKALLGEVSGTVHLDTRGVNITPNLPKGDFPGTAQADFHTSGEARQILAHLQSTGPGERKVDVFLQHEEGLTKIGRGSNIAEGAPLTPELAARLPNIISPPHGGGGGGGGTGGAGSPGGVVGGTGTGGGGAGGAGSPGGGGQAGGAGAAPARQPEAGFGLAGGIFAALGFADLIATVISQAAKGDTDGLIQSGVGLAQGVAVTALLGEAAVPLFIYQGTSADFDQKRYSLYLNNQAPVIEDLFGGGVLGGVIYSASTTFQSIGSSILNSAEHLGGILFGPQGSANDFSYQHYLESIPPGI